MKRGKVFWGVILIAMAVFILFNSMGLIGAEIGVWSIILGLFFIGTFFAAVFNRNVGGAVFSLAFLEIIFDEPLGIPQISAWLVLLIALLITIGISMMFPKLAISNEKKSYNSCMGQRGNLFNKVVEEVSGENIFCANRFGENTKYINTDVKTAKLSNCFGEMKVYFDRASVSDLIEVEVKNSMGEMTIFVPREWILQDSVEVTAGEVGKTGMASVEGNTIMRIRGSINFGELKIVGI